MNAPTPTPGPQKQGGLILGIVITVVIFVLLIGLFTWLIAKTGGKANYYDNLMHPGQQ